MMCDLNSLGYLKFMRYGLFIFLLIEVQGIIRKILKVTQVTYNLKAPHLLIISMYFFFFFLFNGIAVSYNCDQLKFSDISSHHFEMVNKY